MERIENLETQVAENAAEENFFRVRAEINEKLERKREKNRTKRLKKKINKKNEK